MRRRGARQAEFGDVCQGKKSLPMGRTNDLETLADEDAVLACQRGQVSDGAKGDKIKQ